MCQSFSTHNSILKCLRVCVMTAEFSIMIKFWEILLKMGIYAVKKIDAVSTTFRQVCVYYREIVICFIQHIFIIGTVNTTRSVAIWQNIPSPNSFKKCKNYTFHDNLSAKIKKVPYEHFFTNVFLQMQLEFHSFYGKMNRWYEGSLCTGYLWRLSRDICKVA